jgi:hypothetical protein
MALEPRSTGFNCDTEELIALQVEAEQYVENLFERQVQMEQEYVLLLRIIEGLLSICTFPMIVCDESGKPIMWNQQARDFFQSSDITPPNNIVEKFYLLEDEGQKIGFISQCLDSIKDGVYNVELDNYKGPLYLRSQPILHNEDTVAGLVMWRNYDFSESKHATREQQRKDRPFKP